MCIFYSVRINKTAFDPFICFKIRLEINADMFLSFWKNNLRQKKKNNSNVWFEFETKQLLFVIANCAI